jgi:hypothetical protein
MKKLLILAFISNFGFCQNIKQIKKLDTIYIAFTKMKGLEKNVYTDNYRDYRFYLKSRKNKKTEYLYFEKPDRKNSLTEKGYPRIDTRIENKSFLKEHKKDIIDINFLKKFEKQYIDCELLSGSKTFYIIDFTEKRKKKDVILYSVYLIRHCPVDE